MKGVGGWLFQRITGAVLLAGLAVHFYVMHFAGPETLTYEAVARRISEPGWLAFNALFLLSAAYHGFNGVWGMAVEYIHSERRLKAAKVSLTASGVALAAFGLYILAL